jgi:alkylhydroperoxidase/carboxymuconolactone decarboxylase family protein YurZ
MKTILSIVLLTTILILPAFAQGQSTPPFKAVQDTSYIKQHLNAKQKAIIPISAFTASGNINKLKTALNEGLDAGMTVNELKEVLVQMYAYAGFPRSLNGLNTLMIVLEERKKKGIKDKIGKYASPLPSNKSVRELGTEIQTELVGKPISSPVYEFAPIIDTFLKEHLFGDIFSRDVLDFKERELATISALAVLTAEPQLRSHLNVSMNVGLTEIQMREFISILGLKVGKEEADMASKLLDEVVKNRQPILNK